VKKGYIFLSVGWFLMLLGVVFDLLEVTKWNFIIAVLNLIVVNLVEGISKR
jgi:hypothetical protein